MTHHHLIMLVAHRSMQQPLCVDASYSSNVINDINKLNNLYELLSSKPVREITLILSENNITNGAVYPLDFTNKKQQQIIRVCDRCIGPL
jgi:hypothetical protein